MATALVLGASGPTGPYLVEDLSAGGALLSGEPPIALAAAVQLALRLPSGRTVRVSGNVVRAEVFGGEHSAAVAFHHLSAADEDAIQAAVLRALEDAATAGGRKVLVVDDTPAVLRALERDLRALGRTAVLAQTAGEAIVRLERDAAGFEAAFIDLCLGGTTSGLDILAFLAAEHAGIRRVVVTGVVATTALDGAIFGRAHAVVQKPWTRERLAAALGDLATPRQPSP